MTGNLSQFILSLFSNNGQSKEQKFFSNVVGYPDMKRILMESLMLEEPAHILLTGPPASSKTVFLLEMEKLDGAYFIDAVGASGPGVVQHLFENDTKYLLIDEIDKMKKSDQAALLNVMERGFLSETKLKGKTRQKKVKLWIFATSNDVGKLSPELLSRFTVFHLKEYTFNEYLEIARQQLKKRHGLDSITSDKIARSIWYRMNSRDIRDVIKVAKFIKSPGDVDFYVDVLLKYSKNKQ